MAQKPIEADGEYLEPPIQVSADSQLLRVTRQRRRAGPRPVRHLPYVLDGAVQTDEKSFQTPIAILGRHHLLSGPS